VVRFGRVAPPIMLPCTTGGAAGGGTLAVLLAPGTTVPATGAAAGNIGATIGSLADIQRMHVESNTNQPTENQVSREFQCLAN
jgi:hypothetical protein